MNYEGIHGPTHLAQKYFADIFDRDVATIDYVQRFLGYCLTGSTSSQKIGVFFGRGSGSTLIAILNAVMGDYMALASADSFEWSKDNSDTDDDESCNRPDDLLFSCENRRLMAMPDGLEWHHNIMGVCKELTCGDRLFCRNTYGQAINFKSTLKMLIVENAPAASYVREDAGFVRRLVVFPFDRKFTSHISEISARLTEPITLTHFLTWMVQGAVLLHNDTFRFCNKSASMKAAEARYLHRHMEQ